MYCYKVVNVMEYQERSLKMEGVGIYIWENPDKIYAISESCKSYFLSCMVVCSGQIGCNLTAVGGQRRYVTSPRTASIFGKFQMSVCQPAVLRVWAVKVRRTLPVRMMGMYPAESQTFAWKTECWYLSDVYWKAGSGNRWYAQPVG